jgi:hypothetical protein
MYMDTLQDKFKINMTLFRTILAMISAQMFSDLQHPITFPILQPSYGILILNKNHFCSIAAQHLADVG